MISKKRIFLPLVLLATLSFISSASSASTTVSSTESDRAVKSWQQYMAKLHTPKMGCFTAKYPSTVWKSVKCSPPPKTHLNVGNTTDFYSQVASGNIESVTGTFGNITGLVSEVGNFPGYPGTANFFTLQTNSNPNFNASAPAVTLHGSNPCTTPGSCQGWQQFAYVNNGTDTGIFIEYWLFGFHAKHNACPDGMQPPPGSMAYPFVPWLTSGNDCVTNSYSVHVPGGVAISQLGELQFTASSTPTADEVSLAVGTTMYHNTVANVLGLNQDWTAAEFNIFGPGSGVGSVAAFNSGTTMTVYNSITGQSGSVLSPTCGNGSFTGEENNLNLTCPCFTTGEQLFFTQSNATNPACSCPTGSVWNASSASCTCEATGMVMNPVTHQCSCPEIGAVVINGACACPAGEHVENHMCMCPTGTVLNSATHTCMPTGLTCTPQRCPYGCYAPYIGPGGQPVWNCKPNSTCGKPGFPKCP